MLSSSQAIFAAIVVLIAVPLTVATVLLVTMVALMLFPGSMS